MATGEMDYADRAAKNYLSSVKIAMVALLEEAEREGYTTAEQFKNSINCNLDYVNCELKKYKGAVDD